MNVELAHLKFEISDLCHPKKFSSDNLSIEIWLSTLPQQRLYSLNDGKSMFKFKNINAYLHIKFNGMLQVEG